MGKYLKKFNLQNDYDSFIVSDEFVLPNVSYITENEDVHFHWFNPYNGHEYVDLGLPSGKLWAKCNVGANSETDYGLYFAWGETTGYKDINSGKNFSWEDYKHCNGTYNSLTKYNFNDDFGIVDNKKIIDLEDDAAHVNMGGDWRMPTPGDLQELIDNTVYEWTTVNGVNGGLFTSKINGQKIFFPAAGACIYGSIFQVGSIGVYNGSYVETTAVLNLSFNSEGPQINAELERCMGVTVRGIITKKTKPNIPSGNEDSTRYLTFESLEDDNQISFSDQIEYSIGGSNWNSLTNGEKLSLNNGDTVLFKIINPFIFYANGIGCFSTTKKCNISGNIMSLLYGDNFIGKTDLTDKSYAFYGLFSGCTNIVDASKLILPATTLSESCYSHMFSGCSSLTTTPELPATTLASSCYHGMFQGCTGLTTAPALPATTLANYCYNNMFDGCSSLTTTPELPATTLAKYNSYQGMFRGCTSLTTAPELPATTLTTNCYQNMFNGCISLTTAPALPATTLASCCYDSMFYGTNVLPDCSNIDFTSKTVVASGGLQGLFAGTNVTDDDLYNILPINPNTGKYYLPVTTLALQCYYDMFQGCANLTTAPELPATTLADLCYSGMFQGCVSLTTAPELPATKLTIYCYRHMFDGCTSLTTTPTLPATSLAIYCYQGMFRGCTSLTTAPELPVTTLAEYCYQYMFDSCTSLTTAPELPATKLASCCYSGMFSGCSNLNFIKMLATNISASNCLNNWVSGVAPTGTFVKHPDMTSLSNGNGGIPNGWTVEDYNG